MRDRDFVGASALRRTMSNEHKRTVLAACSLFSGLQLDALNRLVAVAQERQVTAGCILLRKGEQSSGLQIIASGAAKLYLSSDAGKELCIRVAGRSSAINAIGPPNQTALLHAISTEPSCVLTVPRAVIDAVMGREHCHIAALQQLTEELGLFSDVLENVALHGLCARVARVLHRLHVQSKQDPAARLHRVDQATLSAMANGSRSKVNEQLHILRRLGAIDIQAGAVVLRRLDVLESAMNHDLPSESAP